MATEIGIIDDASLPATVQSVALLAPYPRPIVVDDFLGNNKPIIQVPILSWAVQYREADIRDKLIAYLKGIFPAYTNQVTTNINALPANMVNNTIANLFYNASDLYTYSLTPRIDNAFCTSVYAAASLWVGYYLSGMLQSDYAGLTDNTSAYRRKQLTDTQTILGYTLRTILGTNPNLTSGYGVIVAATESTTQRLVITCDNARLNQYLNRGGSLNTLCSQWITQKYNPLITG